MFRIYTYIQTFRIYTYIQTFRIYTYIQTFRIYTYIQTSDMSGKSCWNVVSCNTYIYETCNIYILRLFSRAWPWCLMSCFVHIRVTLRINVCGIRRIYVCGTRYYRVMLDCRISSYSSYIHVLHLSYMCMWDMCYTSLYVYVARLTYVLHVAYMYVLHDTTESCSTVESHVVPHIYMCYTSDLCVCYTSDLCVCYTILQSCSTIVYHIMPHIHMCYTSNICMCYTTLESSMTRAYVWHDDVFLRLPCHRGECRCWHFSSWWLIHICNMTCSYV